MLQEWAAMARIFCGNQVNLFLKEDETAIV